MAVTGAAGVRRDRGEGHYAELKVVFCIRILAAYAHTSLNDGGNLGKETVGAGV